MPTVTAVIATFNRAEDLRVCLRNLAAQTRHLNEVIIVDDHSPDHTREVVRQTYSAAQYIRLPSNRGYIFARNLGIATADSDYVLSLDDDSWFEQPDALDQAVAYMDSHPDVGVLGFNVRSSTGCLALPMSTQPADWPTFIGCGHVLRRGAAQAAGLYPEFFRHMGEEVDLALRLLDSGYRTVVCPAIVVYHKQSQQNRNWSQIRYYSHRNLLLLELLRCPKRWLPYFFLRTWLGQTLFNLRFRYWTTDLRILGTVPEMLWIAIRARRRVEPGTYKRWVDLKRSTHVVARA